MRLFLVAILALAASSQAQKAAPAPVEIVNLEQNLWTTMAEGSFTAVRSLFAKDFIQVDDKIQAADAILITSSTASLSPTSSAISRSASSPPTQPSLPTT